MWPGFTNFLYCGLRQEGQRIRFSPPASVINAENLKDKIKIKKIECFFLPDLYHRGEIKLPCQNFFHGNVQKLDNKGRSSPIYLYFGVQSQVQHLPLLHPHKPLQLLNTNNITKKLDRKTASCWYIIAIRIWNLGQAWNYSCPPDVRHSSPPSPPSNKIWK